MPFKLELTPEGRVALTFTTTVAGQYSVLFQANSDGAYTTVGGNWEPDATTIGQLQVVMSPAARSAGVYTRLLIGST